MPSAFDGLLNLCLMYGCVATPASLTSPCSLQEKSSVRVRVSSDASFWKGYFSIVNLIQLQWNETPASKFDDVQGKMPATSLPQARFGTSWPQG